MQLGFGSGVLWGTQLTDATGAAIANPTPVQFGVLQDVAVDLSFNEKMLYGQLQFPVAIGRGTAKMTLKAKNARIAAATMNGIFFGQPAGVVASGLNFAFNEAGTVPTTPFQVTVANAATFSADLGVYYSSTGLPLKRVAAGPTVGQYSVNVATGVYTFAAADTTVAMLLSYSYTQTAINKVAVTSQLLGYTPTFSVDLYVPYQAKVLGMHFYAVTATKLAVATKLEDFIIPEFDMSVFADSANRVVDISTTE